MPGGALIPYLTEMFRFQAWMAMGKVSNPVSGETERNLDLARHCIDLLAEVETKTEGNRSDEETSLLRNVLTDLRLNFMEEMKKPAESPEGEATTEAGAEDSAPGSAEEAASTGDEGKHE